MYNNLIVIAMVKISDSMADSTKAIHHSIFDHRSIKFFSNTPNDLKKVPIHFFNIHSVIKIPRIAKNIITVGFTAIKVLST